MSAVLVHQPLLLGPASAFFLDILVTTDLPLTPEGACSQLQALFLSSERAAVKDIINASSYMCAQLGPCSHPAPSCGATAAEPTAGTSQMNSQLSTESSLPGWLLAPAFSFSGTLAQALLPPARGRLVTFTAAFLTEEVHSLGIQPDSPTKSFLFTGVWPWSASSLYFWLPTDCAQVCLTWWFECATFLSLGLSRLGSWCLGIDRGLSWSSHQQIFYLWCCEWALALKALNGLVVYFRGACSLAFKSQLELFWFTAACEDLWI